MSFGGTDGKVRVGDSKDVGMGVSTYLFAQYMERKLGYTLTHYHRSR